MLQASLAATTLPRLSSNPAAAPFASTSTRPAVARLILVLEMASPAKSLARVLSAPSVSTAKYSQFGEYTGRWKSVRKLERDQERR